MESNKIQYGDQDGCLLYKISILNKIWYSWPIWIILMSNCKFSCMKKLIIWYIGVFLDVILARARQKAQYISCLHLLCAIGCSKGAGKLSRGGERCWETFTWGWVVYFSVSPVSSFLSYRFFSLQSLREMAKMTFVVLTRPFYLKSIHQSSTSNLPGH